MVVDNESKKRARPTMKEEEKEEVYYENVRCVPDSSRFCRSFDVHFTRAFWVTIRAISTKIAASIYIIPLLIWEEKCKKSRLYHVDS